MLIIILSAFGRKLENPAPICVGNAPPACAYVEYLMQGLARGTVGSASQNLQRRDRGLSGPEACLTDNTRLQGAWKAGCHGRSHIRRANTKDRGVVFIRLKLATLCSLVLELLLLLGVGVAYAEHMTFIADSLAIVRLDDLVADLGSCKAGRVVSQCQIWGIYYYNLNAIPCETNTTTQSILIT